jgi:chromosome segregation ATPase
MRTLFYPTILVCIIILSAAGCGKQAISDSRAKRLAADETYRVDQQVAALTKELEQCKRQQTSPAAADKQQNTLLTQENQQLKNSLNEVAANAKNLTDQVEQCQKELSSPTNERVKKMAAEIERTKKEAEDTVNFVMTTVRDEGEKETKAIREENETLKAQIQKLQDELKQLKK